MSQHRSLKSLQHRVSSRQHQPSLKPAGCGLVGAVVRDAAALSATTESQSKLLLAQKVKPGAEVAAEREQSGRAGVEASARLLLWQLLQASLQAQMQTQQCRQHQMDLCTISRGGAVGLLTVAHAAPAKD